MWALYLLWGCIWLLHHQTSLVAAAGGITSKSLKKEFVDAHMSSLLGSRNYTAASYMCSANNSSIHSSSSIYDLHLPSLLGCGGGPETQHPSQPRSETSIQRITSRLNFNLASKNISLKECVREQITPCRNSEDMSCRRGRQPNCHNIKITIYQCTLAFIS